MKKIFVLSMLLYCIGLDAQTLTTKLIGKWQFKHAVDAEGKPLEGTVNPIELDLHKDSTFTMLTKSKNLKGKWTEKDSVLYLQAMPAIDSINHTQIMRIMKIETDMLEIYAGEKKGNEIKFIYVRRRRN